MSADSGISVSIIIPAYNEEECIGGCISSIIHSISRSTVRAEVILVDNGSSDNTVSIAEGLGCTVLHFPKATISRMRNEGARFATGRILAFVDADIVVSMDWFSEAVTCMSEEDIVCLGGEIGIPENATWIERVWHLKMEDLPERRIRSWVPSMNMFVLKDCFLKVGGFSEELVTCEDVDFCMRLSEYGTIFFDKRVSVIHYGEAKNLKHFYLKERWRGQSNLKGFFSHTVTFRELPSILIPVVYLLFFVSIIPQIIVGVSIKIILLQLLLSAAIPILRAIIIIKRTRKYYMFFPLSFLWFVYYTARSMSLVFFSNRRK